MEIDVAMALGAEESFSSQRLTLYLPNKDRHGQELLDLPQWVEQGRKLLSQIGGGATAFPPADGTWVNETGDVIWEIKQFDPPVGG